MLAMTEVLQSPSHFASTSRTVTSYSSSSSLTFAPFNSLAYANQTPPEGDDAYGIVFVDAHIPDTPSSAQAQDGCSTDCETFVKLEVEEEKGDDQRTDRLSLFAFLVTLFRKSLIACRSDRREFCAMEIGWPTEVQHVAHVTFDRFNGFLGLPVEFEPEVPRRPPSASSSVFGVSTESMQLSYDSRGNSVPTILLLMQNRLYSEGGLQAMGIFRINAENGHKEYVRDQLNRGEVPEGIDVHCLAGLIKAWFRELPTGVLDSLSPDQVMQCQSEEECSEPVKHLPPNEAALLDWAINLMADVVEHEHLNRMNARNVAMVFAPNMTRMVDPLTALMYAVQVMNFLKTLILRTLRERKGSVVESCTKISSQHSDDSGNHNPSLSCLKEALGNSISEEPTEEYSSDSHQSNLLSGGESGSMIHCCYRTSRSSNASSKWGPKIKSKAAYHPGRITSEEPKGISNLGRFDTNTEQIKTWL